MNMRSKSYDKKGKCKEYGIKEKNKKEEEEEENK